MPCRCWVSQLNIARFPIGHSWWMKQSSHSYDVTQLFQRHTRMRTKNSATWDVTTQKAAFFTALLQAMPWPSSTRVSELFWHCNYKVHLSLWRTKPEHTFSHNKTATKLGFRLARTCLVNGRDALLMQVVFHEDKRYLSSTQWRSAQNKWGRRIV